MDNFQILNLINSETGEWRQTLTETFCWQEDQTTAIPHTPPSLSCHRLETRPVTPELILSLMISTCTGVFVTHNPLRLMVFMIHRFFTARQQHVCLTGEAQSIKKQAGVVSPECAAVRSNLTQMFMGTTCICMIILYYCETVADEIDPGGFC